jgi:dihydroorotate dehydrogenase electron transfer subunit
MLRKQSCTLLSNEEIAKNIRLARFSGDAACFTAPGQFAGVALSGCYLRRPISVSDFYPGGFEMIYKVVGKGTEILAGTAPGASLEMLAGLGNGFDLRVNTERPLAVGGGIGIPPLYGLAKRLPEREKLTVVLGFNTSEESFYIEEFEALGCRVVVSTVDGSLGEKGFVTDVIKKLKLDYDYVLACGPMPMLKALRSLRDTPGQYSFEARMACGFGACMGCAIETVSGMKRVCRDGPVFKTEEILWRI